MQALILAAGKGTRLSALGPSKPLIPLHGRPLVFHVIERLEKAGAEEFVVVTGHEAETVEAALRDYVEETGLEIRTVRNPEFEEPNGLSVAAARGCMDGPFLLCMCDHLMGPSIIRELAAELVPSGQLVLAVDRRLDNPDVDLDDVTRVRTEGGRIVDIGKGLADFDAFDIGLFLADAALMDAVEAVREAGEAPSLSAAVRRMAAAGYAHVYDIGDRFWIDVDDERAYRLAEERIPT